MGRIENSSYLESLIENAEKEYMGIFNIFTFLAALCESSSDGYKDCPADEKKEIEEVMKAFSFSFTEDVRAEISKNAGRASKDDFAGKITMQSRMYNASVQTEKKNRSEITAGQLLFCILENPDTGIRKITEERKDGKSDDFNRNFEEHTDSEIEQIPENPKEFISALTSSTEEMRKKILASVFGQDHAVNVFLSGYFRAGIKRFEEPERKKPEATYLFAGAPGVGKTFLAEKIAEVMGLPFKRFDMSEYSSREESVGEFIGTDNVYKNAQKGNVTSFVKENRRCVILFDEIEKAHPSVINLFLQILDGGRLRDRNTDDEVSFTDAIIILTTNAGKPLYENPESSDFSGTPREVILNALAEDINPATKEPFFPAAICSRFASGNVVMFNSMSAGNLFKIAEKKMNENIEKFKNSFGISISADPLLYSAVLLAEGGKADGRTVAGRTQSFFMNEVLEFSRLTKDGIGNIENINITVDLKDSSEKIKKLFKPDSDYGVLVFGSGKSADSFRKVPGIRVYEAQDIKTAQNIIRKNRISFAAADIFFGLSKREFLCAEDEKSLSRDFFGFMKNSRPDIPFFAFPEGKKNLSREEHNSLLAKGLDGIIDIESPGFEENIKNICFGLYQQQSLDSLARANRLITFETAQAVSDDGKTGEIRVFDFSFITAVKAGDKDNILSSISTPDVKFSDVIGAEDAKKELSYFVSYLKDPAKYAATGMSAPRGIIFYGPPGTGKTMLAKALAAEAGVTFVATEGNSFLKKYLGEGTKKVHDIFRAARKYAPSVIFIDEIDAIGRERSGNSSEGVENSGVLTALLTEMDGFRNNNSKPVFVLAATNFDVEPGKAKSLDPALMRRFDRRIYIDLPTGEERKKYLKIRLSGNDVFDISDEKLQNIAVRSTGMSLSDINSFIELSMRSAVIDGQEKVDDALLEEAFETFNNGEKKAWSKDVLERVARHEAGHTYINWLSGERPSYVTVVARSDHGGYMQHNDNEDKPIYTKEELASGIRTSLGGRAAEIVYYGRDNGISTGASGDLRNATRLARNMLCAYGMYDDFGLAAADTADIGMSTEIRNKINKILSGEMEKAIALIEKGRASVDALVSALIEKNHLSGKEINEILTDTEKKIS